MAVVLSDMSDITSAADCFRWSSALTSTISFVLGFLSAVFAEPVRERVFRPVLQLSFSGQDDVVAKTRISPVVEAVHVRVKVVNTKRRLARAVRAYLIDVETMTHQNVFARTIYADSIQLAWSCKDMVQQREALDLPKGVSQYVDVIATSSVTNSFEVQIQPFPIRYMEIFGTKPQTFRLTVQVAGDGVDPQVIRIVFAWKGRWDAVDAYEDENRA